MKYMALSSVPRYLNHWYCCCMPVGTLSLWLFAFLPGYCYLLLNHDLLNAELFWPEPSA